MAWFNFEKNLEHQSQAVNSTLAVFEGLEIIKAIEIEKSYVNPIINYKNPFLRYGDNIRKLQSDNRIKEDVKSKNNIIDIMMETWTWKTYTYTKTIFELNKLYAINKFIVVVPTLSIKAGTINFLKSDSSREHFIQQYWKTLNLHIVESQKNSKSKKSYLPPAVSSFVNAWNFDTNQIQILIINAWMINSDTMTKKFDTSLFDKYNIPFDAIWATNSFLIIDEPHKFWTSNKTWENILKMKPQFILRYWATFDTYENLVYKLTSLDAFNKNLVKWVIWHITEFESWKNALVKLISTDWKEANFELIENETKKSIKLKKWESLEKIHSEMKDLIIENLNKTVVVLSNWLQLKKQDKFNPYSYSETLWETMIQKAVKNHFKNEKDFLTRDVRIKPLTLFFIDNIEEYRNKEGYIRSTLEKYIEAEVKELLKTEKDVYYKKYLQDTLSDISKTHWWYFSKDNSEKDEAIEQEVNEILHDKETMLSLDNPRRFIFSKWTLREWWDNPNVFGICKLRSSWSEISKLQEVWRWLRLPVNEFWNRVKDEQFYLNYFVDFTENGFIEKLKDEININSWAFSSEDTPTKLEQQIIDKICEKYNLLEENLLDLLDEKWVIKRNNDFRENWFDYIKSNYPLIFEWVNSNKIRKSTDEKKKIHIRTEKYEELKILWEKLNQKVILEYQIKNEAEFKKILVNFLTNWKTDLNKSTIQERVIWIGIENNIAITKEFIVQKEDLINISTMKYSEFLKELSKVLKINLKTLHEAFILSWIEVNNYLNISTIRNLKIKFENYLLYNAINKFSIEYQKISNSIHPTKITNTNWKVKEEINASDIWVLFSENQVANNYLFEELFYDSDLEEENIKTNINEVIIFSKIPKNSIKIPVAWWKTYSPDFAYVLNFDDWKEKLYFVVETKNTEEENLRLEELQKIKHAEKFFNNWIKIKFETQFKWKKIIDLIKNILKSSLN